MEEECQKAFDRINEYLSKLPVLVPTELGKPLLLYFLVLDNTFGCVLGKHDKTGRNEQAIYYLSKKFMPCEAKYTLIEMHLLCFNMDCSEVKALHVSVHHAFDILAQPAQVLLPEANDYQKTS
uniref:Reverse transcriptase/retrotransposon-derived protein RNase H-like domain-containing protein n=1 Tax=Nicotiana tabacum TaxID=4097 RepID=A0A1S3XCY3_TOBAC|nr:PREDICTED: uncharacterized protein LOC107763804 [Nicotiana tabacum]